MTKSVAVVDYGAGNILNVLRAFRSQAIEADLVTEPAQLRRHSHVVLPGVGSFDYGMRKLETTGLSEAIIQLSSEERPLLGICLGMQLLAEFGLENGKTRGLGLVKGTVAHLSACQDSTGATRIPHTGWAPVSSTPAWSEYSKSRVFPISTAYFNHSFFVSEASPKQIVATVDIGPHAVPAAVMSGSIFAVQFHPEKSGDFGLRMLRSWVHGGLGF